MYLRKKDISLETSVDESLNLESDFRFRFWFGVQVLVAAQEVVLAEEAEKDQLCVDLKLMVRTKGGGSLFSFRSFFFYSQYV